MISVPKEKSGNPPSLISALQGEVTPRVPFWFMRQAGRYLPEYRQLRQRAGSFLNLCFTPELAAEVTLQPLRRFDMDAAILFSDILTVPYALGQQLDFVEGEGPRLGALDISALEYDEKKILPVYETLRLLRRQMPAGKALIGFGGAPWTLACYMVQGFGDGAFETVIASALRDPDAFDGFIQLLTKTTVQYLSGQIRNGADTVQLFDSWAGLLPEPWFTRWVIAPTRQIVQELKTFHPHTPIIGFPRQAGPLYSRYAAETGIDGLGLDQSIAMEDAVNEIRTPVCLQGNLDPALLLAGGSAMRAGAERILAAAKNRPFIFNLGHGVIKETPPEHVAELSRIVRDFQR